VNLEQLNYRLASITAELESLREDRAYGLEHHDPRRVSRVDKRLAILEPQASNFAYQRDQLLAHLAQRAPAAPPPPAPHKHAAAPRGAQLPLWNNPRPSRHDALVARLAVLAQQLEHTRDARTRAELDTEAAMIVAELGARRRPNPGPSRQPQPRAVTIPELRALFERARTRLAKHNKKIHLATLMLADTYASPGSPGGYRDLAWCDPSYPGGPCIYLVRRALALGAHVCEGLLLHELGHCADRRVNTPGREQRADDIAERATGTRVRYDRHNVQTTATRGSIYPRPRHLHR
jgi:hypothetical protein